MKIKIKMGSENTSGRKCDDKDYYKNTTTSKRRHSRSNSRQNVE